MRIVIDLQGAQTASRYRGIGRYTLSFTQALVKNAINHEIWLVLNGSFPDTILEIRKKFIDLVPADRIRVFEVAIPVAELHQDNVGRARASEKIREYFIQQLQPDILLVTSLFEGYVDDAVTSIGAYCDNIPTAVILYDLIPLLNSQEYLSNLQQKNYYETKIVSLKKANLLLAISESSRLEAISALDFSPENVVSISAAVENNFEPKSCSHYEIKHLHQQYKISKKIILYVPGGDDARKNFDNLIAAYGALPIKLRDEYQLIIIGNLGTNVRRGIRAQEEQFNLKKENVILTGYVSDDDLYIFYRAATLVVFASRHEGFGLPVLEAMTCGAPVIASNTTSVPEIIDNQEALFDPTSVKSIANKIEQMLNDEDLRKKLSILGLERAKKFSWNNVAKKALSAIEGCNSIHSKKLLQKPPVKFKKYKLAYISPLPPEKTGIAKYSTELLSELINYYDIDLIVDQDAVRLPESLVNLPQHSIEWFIKNKNIYDRILYHIGNSAFHVAILKLLELCPGVIVLHDFFLGSLLMHRSMNNIFSNTAIDDLYYSHGYLPLAKEVNQINKKEINTLIREYPCNLEILQNAQGIIVHSKHCRELSIEWYGKSTEDWHVIPLLRATPENLDRKKARQTLGIDENVFLICSFGFIDVTKLNYEILSAWLASNISKKANCKLVLVGAYVSKNYADQLHTLFKSNSNQGNFHVTGWVSRQIYEQYLQAADLCIQLRTSSRGETSAAALDCMNYGLPVIVNAHGAMVELPKDTVWMLPDKFTQQELIDAIEMLYNNDTQRHQLGAAAKQLIQTKHTPSYCAQQYVSAIESAYNDEKQYMSSLIQAVSEIPNIPTSDKELKNIAKTISNSLPPEFYQRQLFVDISAIVWNDLKTGIERVVRSELIELLKNPPAGYRVEPVYLLKEGDVWLYRYARKFTFQMIDAPTFIVHDLPINVYYGDIFYALGSVITDFTAALQAGTFLKWQTLGVPINVRVYDLLPILKPQFFPSFMEGIYTEWLKEIMNSADQLIAISKTVANDLCEWTAKNSMVRFSPIKITYIPLGANIESSLSDEKNVSAQVVTLQKLVDNKPSFLMVGTIEPRKGYAQVLAAFEKLWESGAQVYLIIVGKEGWLTVSKNQRQTIATLVGRLRKHPELGKRLFWLDSVTDVDLKALYQSCKCLIAASEGEGFGLPLIEASHYKIPIIARNLPVFREILNQSAYYFTGEEPEMLAEAIKNWLNLPADKKANISQGVQWHTWAEVSQNLLSILVNHKAEKISVISHDLTEYVLEEQ